LGEFYYNQGGSVIRIARASHKAHSEVVRDPKNRRLHGLSGLALNAERTAVIAWGGAPRQQGTLNYVLATGRAAREVFPLSSDGLGARIIGTAFNCSGATTPWQTVLSAEENFQGSSSSYCNALDQRDELIEPHEHYLRLGGHLLTSKPLTNTCFGHTSTPSCLKLPGKPPRRTG
jgi:uncharacterized protein